ncbi:UNVERIFIED_ORG: hypothetical protein ABID33_000279 [Xanthobacter viscosus]
MIRIAIDQDGDGAFVVITRPGQAAERWNSRTAMPSGS